MNFQVGDVLGTYTILAHLRSGGMADLYLGRREGAAGFRRLVAIKVIHPRHAQDEQLVRMFLDEALISARVDHPNVVHVEDLGQIEDTYFLVMEYVHGGSLAQLMRMLGSLRRRLSPLVAVAIAARVAEGLHAAHETTDDDGSLVSLVHRDVSPQNILLSHKGHVKLIDFGVAKARLRTEETNVATLKGKVRYMAPEQATTGIVDRRSDIYALGIVLWEMLTMRRLFAGKTEFEVLLKVRDPKIPPPSRFVPDVPKELDAVLAAALARDPDDRPKNAKVFRRMLARALPQSMALDSAHLADLLVSVVGDELDQIRHDLPHEVSRVLAAEQLRVMGLEKEERALKAEGGRDTSAVASMTVHSELALFEEDELDESPEPVPPRPEDSVTMTRPGSPQAMQRLIESAAPRRPAPPVAAKKPRPPRDLNEPPAGAIDDADPTLVAGVPVDVVEQNSGPPPPPPVVHRPLAETALTPTPLVGVRPTPQASAVTNRVPRVLPYAIALVVSVLIGIAIALLWPRLRAMRDDEPRRPVSSGPRSLTIEPLELSPRVDGGLANVER